MRHTNVYQEEAEDLRKLLNHEKQCFTELQKVANKYAQQKKEYLKEVRRLEKENERLRNLLAEAEQK